MVWTVARGFEKAAKAIATKRNNPAYIERPGQRTSPAGENWEALLATSLSSTPAIVATTSIATTPSAAKARPKITTTGCESFVWCFGGHRLACLVVFTVHYLSLLSPGVA
ncbi:MAG: hypothetical protein ACFB50_12165 [Rubrobacteraceae bacterium]